MISKLLEIPLIKALIATILSIVTFLFGDVYQEALLAILMLFIFDTVTGMIASYYEGLPITSRRFMGSVTKGTIYFASISAAYFTDITIPGSLFQSVMIAFVGTTEFISILENIGRMGYQTPKKLLGQLRENRLKL